MASSLPRSSQCRDSGGGGVCRFGETMLLCVARLCVGLIFTGFGELCSRIDLIVQWFRSILLLLRPQGIDALLRHFVFRVRMWWYNASAPRGSHHHNHKPARTRPFRPRPRKASQAIAKRSSKTGLDVEHNSSRASKQAA